MATVTRTVVFTDLANYTRTTAGWDREQLRDLIAHHEAHTRAIFEPRGGRIIKNLGDAFLALFQSATDALTACMELCDQGLPGSTFQIRGSAATGDVEEIDDDVFGDAVNLSARINSKVPAGEVWFAGSTRMVMSQAEIPWEPVGTFHFKGVPEEISCYRAVTASRCILPAPVVEAARKRMIVRVRPDSPPARVSPQHLVVFSGFTRPEDLQQAVARLPVLDPARLWLDTYTVSALARKTWRDAGRGLIIGKPETVNASLDREMGRVPSAAMGSNTILFDTVAPDATELVLAGLALPRVPLVGIVDGYTYDLMPSGTWGAAEVSPLLRVHVTSGGVEVEVAGPGVVLDGRSLNIGDRNALGDDARIHTPVGAIRYRSLRAGAYAGLLFHDSNRALELGRGDAIEVGREPAHPGLALPDRGAQRNIRWCTGAKADRARAAGFTLDRALAGRRHARIHSDGDGTFRVEPVHTRLATHLYQHGGGLRRLTGEAMMGLDDHLITGTSVLSIRRLGD